MSTAKSEYLSKHHHRGIDIAGIDHDDALVKKLRRYGLLSPDETLTELTTTSHGLTSRDSLQRLNQFGRNEIVHEQPTPWWAQFGQAFVTPFTLILAALSAISYITDVWLPAPADRSWAKVIIIGSMVLLSGGLRFWQEFQSQKAATALRRLVQNRSNVLRPGKRQSHASKSGQDSERIPVTHLVPGDVITLAAGDMIPADIRLLSADDLYVSQAALTGEAMPVAKMVADPSATDNTDPLEMATLCFTGTNVVSGTAQAVIIATGANTYLGSLAQQVIQDRPLTSFDKGVNSIGTLLVRFMLVMVPLVFLINGLTKHDWQSAFLFAVAVAVGLTPELLAVVVTANLAKGAVLMARKKVIIKKLNAIQNFGAMDVLCTDKTGTLTENHIALVRHLDSEGNDSNRVLDLAYLNSFLQTGLSNLLDQALVDYYHDFPDNQQKLFDRYRKLDEIPFDFTRRRLSVLVAKPDGARLLICKGAVEEVIAASTKLEHADGHTGPLTVAARQRLIQMADKFNATGLRLLAVGSKSMPATASAVEAGDDEGLNLIGFVAFLDPPKATAKQAIDALKSYGIQLKIITGDNEVVTQRVCQEVDFPVTGVLLGHQIEHLSDKQLSHAVEQASVFAKVDPLQKARLIKALRTNGHTVGYMGDGVNDAAAMHQSDVGISVDGGVDIAKEAADIVLLKHDLMVLVDGVIQGRTVFGNIMKYIKMTVSSNFGNMLSVLVASAFLPFLPMLPIHLLVQNLIYDLSQFSLPWDGMDKEFLATPREWDATGIAQFMLSIGPLSSIFDLLTFAVMWFVFSAQTAAHQSLFQSGWFVEGLLSQTLIVYMIRTQRIPFVQSLPSRPVLILTMFASAVGVALPFTTAGSAIGFQPLPIAYFGWLVAILVSYAVVAQLAKVWYVRRFNRWL